MLEEHCSPYSADAATNPVEINSDHPDISSTNVQQAQWKVPEEPNEYENGHSLQLLTDVAPVPQVRSYGELTHTDTDLHCYSRRSHQPPQSHIIIDYDLQ